MDWVLSWIALIAIDLRPTQTCGEEPGFTLLPSNYGNLGIYGNFGNFLVHVRKIHPGNELQPGNLPRVVMHFQVGFHDGNVDELTLSGVLALYSHAVQFQVTVMSEDEFVDYGGVHDH